jgi:SAM-dependent methyltransferase
MPEGVMDWDSEYREQGVFPGPPPWNIGEPQPEFAELISRGIFRSDVLDAGCGFAEASLALAAQGYTVVGIDGAPTAIAAATKAAAERGLDNASFVQADITSFTGYDDRFATILDSGLLHSLPVEARDDYLRSVHRAAAPGAIYYVLAFAIGAFLADAPRPGPHPFTEDELREAVSNFWEIDEIRPAFIHAKLPHVPEVAELAAKFELDEKGRGKMPAFLLTAHKAG